MDAVAVFDCSTEGGVLISSPEEETFDRDLCDDEFQGLSLKDCDARACGEDDRDYELAEDDEKLELDIEEAREAFAAPSDEVDEVIAERRRLSESPEEEEVSEVLAASAHEPGSGAVDTGRAKGVIGEEPLETHMQAMKKAGLSVKLAEQANSTTFRFGNQDTLESIRVAQISAEWAAGS